MNHQPTMRTPEYARPIRSQPSEHAGPGRHDHPASMAPAPHAAFAELLSGVLTAGGSALVPLSLGGAPPKTDARAPDDIQSAVDGFLGASAATGGWAVVLLVPHSPPQENAAPDITIPDTQRHDQTSTVKTPRCAGSIASLTTRELEVLRLVADGKTNHQIAESLWISPKTVSVHVSRILTKLGTATRTGAAGMAHRAGILEP